MRGAVASIIIAISVAGCGGAPMQISDRRDYVAEATRIYSGEDKERVIQAAETIIKTSDPGDVEVRYTNNGFSALRRYFIYAVLAAVAGQEKWDFHVEERLKAVEASLSISDAGTAASTTATPYDRSMSSIPLYRLFWKRMDYMLGKRPDWVSCDEEAKALEASGTNPIDALSGLCGGTSNGRDTVPAPLPSRALTAAEKNSADRQMQRKAVMYP